MLFLDEIKARLSLPTPAFWKKLQKRTAATSAGFTGLTVAVASFNNHLPAIVPTIIGGAAVFFGSVASICPLAIEDPAALNFAPPVAAACPVYRGGKQ